jgi:hypothetical protein
MFTGDDARVCFRLVHDLCELGDDPYAWNTRLLQGLEELVGADGGAAYVIGHDIRPDAFQFKLYLDHQLNETWSRYLDDKGIAEQPHTPAMMARMGTDFTVARQELISDEAWYASKFYHDVVPTIGWDQALMSHVFIASMGTIHGLGMCRRIGGPPFAPREIALVRCVHDELARLWRKPESVEIDSLPKRLVETVSGMRRGLSRKEIADELGISPHTVHTYERQLFDRFDVRGRGELLARLARAIRPALPK